MSDLKELPDIQNSKTQSEPIPKVGIRNLLLNIGGTDVYFSIYLNLKGDKKGINMSRLPRALNKHNDKKISLSFLEKVISIFLKQNDCEDAYIKAKHKILIETESPVSKIKYKKHYDVMYEVKSIQGKISKYITVKMPYISTCPCSAELCKNNFGYPHQQRSLAEIKIKTDDDSVVKKTIIDFEKTITSVPHTIVKREDELFIAEQCYKNTIFVEDSVRLIKKMLDKYDYEDYVIVVNHYESIHGHDVVAIIRKGVDLK